MQLHPGAGLPLDPLAAAIAGMAGGAAMFVVRALLSAVRSDVEFDVLRMWEALVRIGGTSGMRVAVGIHLLVSVLVGVAYALGFQIVGVRDELWLWGLVGALVHWLAGGLFLAIVPPVATARADRRTAPRAFARGFGRSDAVAFLVVHLAYGVVFAVGYGLARDLVGAGALAG